MVKKSDESLIRSWMDKAEGRVDMQEYKGYTWKYDLSKMFGTTQSLGALETTYEVAFKAFDQVEMSYLSGCAPQFSAEAEATDFLRALKAAKYSIMSEASWGWMSRIGLYFVGGVGELSYALLYTCNGFTSPKKVTIQVPVSSESIKGQWLADDSYEDPHGVFYAPIKEIIDFTQLWKNLHGDDKRMPVSLFFVEDKATLFLGDKDLFFITTSFHSTTMVGDQRTYLFDPQKYIGEQS